MNQITFEIVESLKPLKGDFPENYTWEIQENILKEIDLKINGAENNFEKNVSLKLKLNEALENANEEEFLKLSYWFIKKWGGISGFKENEKNNNKINDVRKGIIDFGSIASFSKIASVFNPEEYCIYDSRTIYALNWLIFRTKPNGIKYFPTPIGRNKTLQNFNISTLINFFNIERQIDDIYYKKEEAYNIYCSLLKEINLNLWDDENWKKYPFYTEMLLFSLSPDQILNEVKKNIKIEVIFPH